MRPAKLVTFAGMLCCCREPDPACAALVRVAPQLEQRLVLPEPPAGTPEEVAGQSRALTQAAAQQLLQQVQVLKTELPASAKDQELDVMVKKLDARRAALEEALRDFVAINPALLEDGMDSGDTMPARRGVVMSRNALVNLASTVRRACEGAE